MSRKHEIALFCVNYEKLSFKNEEKAFLLCTCVINSMVHRCNNDRVKGRTTSKVEDEIKM